MKVLTITILLILPLALLLPPLIRKLRNLSVRYVDNFV